MGTAESNTVAATRAESPLVAILKDELRLQRVFLSSDEEVALARPLSYENEDDLAFDRVRHRRNWLLPMLRNRFIRDGRPIDLWRAYIAADEAAAGEPTFISGLATGVLEWAARTSDRGAMFAGFAARLLSFIALVWVFLGLYGWTHGGAIGGAVFVALGVACFFGGRSLGAFARRRTATLTEALMATPVAATD